MWVVSLLPVDVCWAQSSVHICKHLLWSQSSSLASVIACGWASFSPVALSSFDISCHLLMLLYRATSSGSLWTLVFYPSIVPIYVAHHPCSHHTVPCFLSSLLIVLQKKVSTYIVPIVPCCYYNTNIYKLITYPQYGVIRILKNTCMSIVI